MSPIPNFIRNSRRGTGSDCYRPLQSGQEGSKNCEIERDVMAERSVKSFLIFSADKIHEVLDKLQQNFGVQVLFLQENRIYLLQKNLGAVRVQVLLKIQYRCFSASDCRFFIKVKKLGKSTHKKDLTVVEFDGLLIEIMCYYSCALM